MRGAHPPAPPPGQGCAHPSACTPRPTLTSSVTSCPHTVLLHHRAPRGALSRPFCGSGFQSGQLALQERAEHVHTVCAAAAHPQPRRLGSHGRPLLLSVPVTRPFSPSWPRSPWAPSLLWFRGGAPRHQRSPWPLACWASTATGRPSEMCYSHGNKATETFPSKCLGSAKDSTFGLVLCALTVPRGLQDPGVGRVRVAGSSAPCLPRLHTLVTTRCLLARERQL